MPRFWTPVRRHDPELMDAPGLDESEVADAYRVLRRVNRQLGNLLAMRRELARALREDPVNDAGPSVLDVGSGSGDIPGDLSARLDRRGGHASVYVLDRDPTALALADRQALRTVRGDALNLPFASASIDLITAVKFAHHFHGPRLALLVAEMSRVARHRVIVLDIRRHWLAYWGFVLWSRVFTTNRLVRHDGPLSVLRGFTARELAEVAAPLLRFSWSVRHYPGFQLALVGRRIEPTSEPETPARPDGA